MKNAILLAVFFSLCIGCKDKPKSRRPAGLTGKFRQTTSCTGGTPQLLTLKGRRYIAHHPLCKNSTETTGKFSRKGDTITFRVEGGGVAEFTLSADKASLIAVAGGPAFDSCSECLSNYQTLDSLIALKSAALKAEATGADFRERSVLYQQNGELARAISDMNKALILAPGNASLYLRRGELWKLRGMPDKAASDLNKAKHLVRPGNSQ